MLELGLTFQVAVWLAVALTFAATGRATMFHPLTHYLAFHGLVFVARPLLVQLAGFDMVWNYMQFEPSQAQMAQTLWVTSTALVVFAAACLMSGRGLPRFGPVEWTGFDALDRKALWITVLLLAGPVAYSIYATRSGIEGEQVGGAYILTGSSGYANDAQHMAGPLIAFVLVAARFRWLAWIPVGFYMGYRAYFGWSRWSLVLFFLMLVLFHTWQSRRRWPAWWAGAMVLPILLLFHALGENRDLVKRWIELHPAEPVLAHSVSPVSERYREKFDTLDFANFDFLTYVLAVVPEQTGTFTFGAQYLQVFTEPIPRALWTRKPIGSPVPLFNLNAYGNFYGLTVSLVGDGWMSGGWLGVIATMALAGAGLGWAHGCFWRHQHRLAICLLYLSALSLLAQLFRDGGISILKFLLFTWLPVLSWISVRWWLEGRPTRVDERLIEPGSRVDFGAVLEFGSSTHEPPRRIQTASNAATPAGGARNLVAPGQGS
jgi:hypothetical protein